MTKARDISSLIGSSGQIDNAKITLDTNEIPNLDAGKITSGSLGADRIPNLSADKITSGTFADARISNSSVSQHATSFDDNKIVNDISTLALRQASDQNKSAYNTNSQSVDVFQDDTGIDTETNTDRNSNEYITTLGAGAVDSNYSNVWLILEDSSTNVTSTQSGSASTANPSMNNQSFSTNQSKFGNQSLYFVENRTPSTNTSVDFAPSGFPTLRYTSNVWTLEMFVYQTQRQGSNVDPDYYDNPLISVGDTYTSITTGSTGKFRINQFNAGRTYNYWDSSYIFPTNQWVHVTVVWGSSTIKLWIDGVYKGSVNRIQLDSACPTGIRFGSAGQGFPSFDGYMDSIRLTNAERYTGTSNISVPSSPHYPNNSGIVATGNFTGTTITAPSSVSEMGAIITYQDQAGTNALNTDIVLQLSADGGSNYSTATLTALPDFSTGIKMAKVNDLAVTAGTQLKYKLNFANQASGSKEARIRGVSLQY